MPRHVIHTRRGHSKNEESESGWSGRAMCPPVTPAPRRLSYGRAGSAPSSASRVEMDDLRE